MKDSSAKFLAKRFLFYLAGFVVQAFGLTLNSKTGLGNTPVTAICFVAAKIWDISLGAGVFAIYVVMMFLQIVLLRGRFEKLRFLQLVAGVIGSALIQIYDMVLPECAPGAWQWVGLLVATLAVGIGASLIVGMKLWPNPADGFAEAIGLVLHKDFGFGKNVLDALCVILSVVLAFLFFGKIIGIGFGTVFATIFTGRVSAFMRPFVEKLKLFEKNGVAYERT
ncbi:MAG: hypothetical protein IKI31_01620 [Treponema sp.]|nr:hypothetical protein [Treponema sp.]